MKRPPAAPPGNPDLGPPPRRSASQRPGERQPALPTGPGPGSRPKRKRGLPPALSPADRTGVWVAGQRLAYFAGCDYYRLSTHPVVLSAAREALDRWGFGVAASRLTTGNHPLYEELEAWLARFFQAPAALLVHTGYATNPIVAQALAGEVTAAFLDARSHASLREAAALLGCPVQTFAHGEAADLRRRLRRLKPGTRPLVLTDGVFAHDGSVAPLVELLAALPPEGRMLVDEAHAAGVLGAGGRGTAEAGGVDDARMIRTATLSKAFGASGGVILGNRSLVDEVIARSRWFAASTPAPLPAAAAALAAGQLIAGDAAMRTRLRNHATRVKTTARAAGFAVPETPAPMLGLTPADEAEGRRWRRALVREGVFPSLIQYPGGPPGGFLRIAFSSEHSEADLARLEAALVRCGAEA